MPTTTAKKAALLSDEPTVELVRMAREGDDVALEALLQGVCRPSDAGPAGGCRREREGIWIPSISFRRQP